VKITRIDTLRLGIDVRDDVLPLTPTPGCFPPFWLDLDRALAYA
jgi:hypothetical protein